MAATDPALSRRRLAALREAARSAGVGTVVLGPGADLRYVLGIDGDSHERLTCLVVPADPGLPAALVSPALELAGLGHVPLDACGVSPRPWVDGEDPYALALTDVRRAEPLAVSDDLPARHAFGLRDSCEGPVGLAGPVVRSLRMRKDEAEVEQLRLAGAAIDRVHARVGEWLRPGRTEAAVAADIAAAIVEEGHASADFVIVGSGPNGASPHHTVSDRVVEAGDVVVVDIGGPLPSGYHSDSTRTYALGEPREPGVVEAYSALRRAQEAAVAAVRPGVPCEDVDAAARRVLAEAGLDAYFIHRTGHGIGLEVHEEPYVVAGNTLALEQGMAFSIEPGIYLPGRWGARIEDIVVVTDDGVERLNRRPRELVVL